MADATLIAEIRAEIKDLKKGIKDAQTEIANFSKKSQEQTVSLKNSFVDFAAKLYVVTSAFKGMVRVIGTTLTAFRQQEQAEARLTQALKNQGLYTEYNIDRLKKLADARQLITTFGDEETISAQALLATYGLTIKQIEQMTPLVQDLAEMSSRTSGGQKDLESVTRLVATAMEGEAGRLRALGVNLTDAEEKTMKLADSSTRVNILMNAMRRSVGDVAESVGTTLTGQLEIAKNTWNEVKESFGKGFTEGITGSGQLIDSLKELIPVAEDLGIAVSKALNLFTGALDKLNKGISQAANWAATWKNVIAGGGWEEIKRGEKRKELVTAGFAPKEIMELQGGGKLERAVELTEKGFGKEEILKGLRNEIEIQFGKPIEKVLGELNSDINECQQSVMSLGNVVNSTQDLNTRLSELANREIEIKAMTEGTTEAIVEKLKAEESLAKTIEETSKTYGLSEQAIRKAIDSIIKKSSELQNIYTSAKTGKIVLEKELGGYKVGGRTWVDKAAYEREKALGTFDDFISRPGLPAIKINPQDTLIGFKKNIPQTAKNVMNTINVTINGVNKTTSEMARELGRLIQMELKRSA